MIKQLLTPLSMIPSSYNPLYIPYTSYNMPNSNFNLSLPNSSSKWNQGHSSKLTLQKPHTKHTQQTPIPHQIIFKPIINFILFFYMIFLMELLYSCSFLQRWWNCIYFQQMKKILSKSPGKENHNHNLLHDPAIKTPQKFTTPHFSSRRDNLHA